MTTSQYYWLKLRKLKVFPPEINGRYLLFFDIPKATEMYCLDNKNYPLNYFQRLMNILMRTCVASLLLFWLDGHYARFVYSDAYLFNSFFKAPFVK